MQIEVDRIVYSEREYLGCIDADGGNAVEEVQHGGNDLQLRLGARHRSGPRRRAACGLKQ
jgi:hypothetical protein